MSATKKEIMADLKYCKESLDRIIRYADKSYEDGSYFTHYTVIQADIIKLRRELNEINHKFAWDYGRK
jgi:hypothetical protein